LAYKVLFNNSIEKDLKRIDATQQKRILDVIDVDLTGAPKQSGSPLKGKYKGFWKLYVIPYRVIYSIDDKTKTIRIEKIGHRKDIYR
jgi:mRNA interferase RelE/StbE